MPKEWKIQTYNFKCSDRSEFAGKWLCSTPYHPKSTDHYPECNPEECPVRVDRKKAGITTRDFKKYYCNKLKKHVWVLGYFGGGAINFELFSVMAEKFVNETGVPLGTVYIDEIIRSRRFKGFKFIYSNAKDQTPLPDSSVNDDVFEWLQD